MAADDIVNEPHVMADATTQTLVTEGAATEPLDTEDAPVGSLVAEDVAIAELCEAEDAATSSRVAEDDTIEFDKDDGSHEPGGNVSAKDGSAEELIDNVVTNELIRLQNMQLDLENEIKEMRRLYEKSVNILGDMVSNVYVCQIFRS